MVRREIGVDPRAHHKRAQEGQRQKQDMQPPALARRPDDPDLRLRFPFGGGRKSGFGFGHERGQRFEVRLQR